MHDHLDPRSIYPSQRGDLGTIESADGPRLSFQKRNVQNEWMDGSRIPNNLIASPLPSDTTARTDE